MVEQRNILLVLVFIGLTACAGSGVKKPDWVNGDSSAYPDEAYLTGRGQSESRAVGQDRARADLSKIFEVNVSEQSVDVVRYERKSTDDDRPGQLDATASREVITRSNQVIQGIHIAELWQDPDNGQFHALAVLDRNRAANDLRQVIQEQDRAITREVALAKQQSELFSRIRHANRAVELQQARNHDQRLLKIVDSTGIGVQPGYNLQVLRADRNDLLQRLQIQSRVINDPIGELAEIVNGAIARAGFVHGVDNGTGYRLDSDLQVKGFRDDDGWFWYRGSLQISLVDIQDGSNKGSYRWEIKVSSQNAGTAAQRVREMISRTLDNELRDVVLDFGAAD